MESKLWKRINRNIMEFKESYQADQRLRRHRINRNIMEFKAFFVDDLRCLDEN